MNNKNINFLTIRDFKLGDPVCHLRPDGSDGEEGTVTGLGVRDVEVMFDDAIRPKTMSPHQLRNLRLSRGTA